MAAKTEWTEEMVAIAVGMKRAGFTGKAIARRLGLSEAVVQRHLHKMGVRKTLRGRPHARPLHCRVLAAQLTPLTED